MPTNPLTNMVMRDYLAGKYQIFDFDDTFKYSLQQMAEAQYDKVFSIDTNWLFGVFYEDSPDTALTYTLRPNETLQFFAPNLIDLRTYSNYVKYEYINTQDSSATIPVDTDYKLGPYENIIVYWKTEDSADVHYQYAKFGTGAIFKPTFTVYTTETTYGSTLPLGQGVVLDEALNAHISEDVTSILTGNRQISNRAINLVNLQSEFNYCYWVRNSKTKVGDAYKYALFDDGSDTYMLQSGEYFIYTNNSFSSLNIVGAGTKIERTRLAGQSTDPLYVDVIDYSDILSDGLNAISYDTWYSFKGAELNITLTEMQLLNLNEGCSVTFTRTDTTKWMRLTNAGVTEGTATLADFTVTYTVPGETTVYNLPVIADTSIAWDVRTLLSLDLSSTKPQTICGTALVSDDNISVQRTTVHYLDQGEIATATIPSEDPSEDYAILLLANRDLISAGLHSIDTTFLTEDGKTEYLALYAYTYSTVSVPEQLVYLDDQSITFRFNNTITGDNAPTISFSLPELSAFAVAGVSMYVLKMVNPNTDCTVKISEINAGVATEIIPMFEADTSQRGVYYYTIGSVTDTESISITQLRIEITAKSTPTWESITIAPVTKAHLKFSEYLNTPVGTPTAEYAVRREKARIIHSVLDAVMRQGAQFPGFAPLFRESEGQSYDPFDVRSYFNKFNPYSRFVIPRLRDININIVNKD